MNPHTACNICRQQRPSLIADLATNLVNERTGTQTVPDVGVAALVEAILLAVGVGVCKCDRKE
jgi:hypothetical protein